MTRHPLGYQIANGAAWVGRRRIRDKDASYWQDGTDPEATLHGPYPTNDEAEKAARENLHITDDE